jgi:hypothetical protein
LSHKWVFDPDVSSHVNEYPTIITTKRSAKPKPGSVKGPSRGLCEVYSAADLAEKVAKSVLIEAGKSLRKWVEESLSPYASGSKPKRRAMKGPERKEPAKRPAAKKRGRRKINTLEVMTEVMKRREKIQARRAKGQMNTRKKKKG